ncbi:hypothetical protein GCM10010340_47860 [Streptomyces griseoloalbus]|nr:hypothetical protein GCM10010340_47860 [Streptomyces albaduncus]
MRWCPRSSRDGVGIDPADLGVLAGFAVLGFAGPVVGGEDDREEAVEGLHAPSSVDDVGDLEAGFTVRPVSS